MLQMHIDGWDEPVPLARGTLLDAGLQAGVPIPNQCRAGECGSCKCQLLGGHVQKLAHMPDALSDAEDAQGWILSCRCLAKSSVSVRFAQPLGPPVTPPGHHVAQVEAVTPLCHDVIELRLRCPQPVLFHAGQYFDLTVSGLPARSYSAATAPGGQDIAFLIKVLPGGLVSPRIASGLALGTILDLSGPYGSSCMASATDAPVLLAGGGTGLAPLLSIIRWLAIHAPSTRVHLYFGVRNERDLFADDALRALATVMPNLQIHRILSDQSKRGMRRGFIGPAIAEDHATLDGFQVFVAGPPVMVDHCTNAVLRLGADPARVFADRFVSARPNRMLDRMLSRLGFRARHLPGDRPASHAP